MSQGGETRYTFADGRVAVVLEHALVAEREPRYWVRFESAEGMPISEHWERVEHVTAPSVLRKCDARR